MNGYIKQLVNDSLTNQVMVIVVAKWFKYCLSVAMDYIQLYSITKNLRLNFCESPIANLVRIQNSVR